MTNLKRFAQGVSWSAAATLVKAGVQFVIFILLARYLSLGELGLVAFVTLLISISQLLSDAGISNALIYFDKLDKQVKCQLYVLGLLLVAVMAALILFLLPVIEAFFNISNLADYHLWIGSLLLLRGAAAQPTAILQKRLAFKQLATIEVFASVASLLTLVYLLQQGATIEAALSAQLTNAMFIALCTSWYGKDELGFALPRVKKLRGPLRYGIYQSAEGVVSFLSRQFDQLVVAKVMGAEVLGVYSYIKELVAKPALQFINPIVNRVTFPSLVKLNVQQKGILYIKLMMALGCINIPLYIGIACFAEPTLVLAFGKSWLEHNQLVSVMAIAMLSTALINPCGPLLQASGAVRRSFIWNLALSLLRAAIILAMVSRGLYELALALAVLQGAVLAVHWFILVTPFTNKGIFEFIKSLLPGLTITMLALLISLLIQHYFFVSDFFALVIYALATSAGLVLLITLLKSKSTTSLTRQQ
ncbi:oligosaccharide flippase family protein [Pseudoalteromonas sp. OANN1]|uniref:oligosaccharide flippase family protein n=1 Tax=Pseudoalteromonas sp. OANN1 TaxID=2954497 RepID=UPI002097C1B6|nr:oligosaccharide flippase family protein [Pseudoalteromonas sp. OANN1]MCO7198227.1 oligosaccharide flippase family protein [Pseudoalteromonas sp. OANN1]